MSTLGLAAVTALAAGLVVFVLHRGRAARPAGPRTVAELVELRAARGTLRPAQPAASGGKSGAPAIRRADPWASGPGLAGRAEPTGPAAADRGRTATAERSGIAESDVTPPADRATIPGAAIPGAATSPAATVAPAATFSPVDTAAVSPTDAGHTLPGDTAAASPPDTADAGTRPQLPEAPWTRAERVRAAADPESEVAAAPRPAPADPAADPSPASAQTSDVDAADLDTGPVWTVPVAQSTSDASRPRQLSLVPPIDQVVPVVPAPREPTTGAFPIVHADLAESLAGAADIAVRRTFGLVGPTPDPDPTVPLSGVPSLGSRPEDTGPARSVRFRVTRRDGSVVAGACLSLLDTHGREVAAGYADAAGAGELRVPQPGSYLLLGTAPDHQPSATRIGTADEPADVEVMVVRSATITGSVRSRRGPVADAQLTLVQNGEIVDEVRSDLLGRYRLADLAGGEYGLSVTAGGCAPLAALLQLSEGTESRQDVLLEPTGGLVPEQHSSGNGNGKPSTVHYAAAGNR